jgi:sugar phosphate isomerase/epimerase
MGYGVADDLILSTMTLRYASLVERIEASGIAGFRGIGWRLDDFVDARRAGLEEEELIHLMNLAKVLPLEVEFFREWLGLEDDPAYQARETELFSLAGRLGARHMNVFVFESRPKQEIIARFAGLCRRASRYGLIVQLEFMPYTPPVDTLQNAWDIIQEAGEPNAGLLIDAWHWARTDGPGEALKRIPPERITSIQLGDILAKPLPEVTEESRHHRCIPGKGAMDLASFLRTLEEHGVQAPLSVEVISDELDAMPALEAARDVAQGTRSVLWRTVAGKIPEESAQSSKTARTFVKHGHGSQLELHNL